MQNVLEKFETTAAKHKDKILFREEGREITFGQFEKACKTLATKIVSLGIKNKPIAVIDTRSINTLIGMFSAIYSGNFYVVLDGQSPESRLNTICDVCSPAAILCEKASLDLASRLTLSGSIPPPPSILIDENVSEDIDEKALNKIREESVSTDPLYILFTSGSTGVPKGTIITHANMLSYINWFASCFNIGPKTSFGSQTPFYFSASVSDLYSSLMYGATYNIIPKSYFSFPIKLIEFLNKDQVNTIYWVPSALCIVANLDLFKYAKPEHLKKVMFVGEIMPCKQLNYWMKHLPKVKFANLFGPTETTDICTYYKVNRAFKDDDSLPIGKSCENLDTFIVDENLKKITTPFVQGELYVRGPFVAPGYYNNPEATNKAFIQNPLQSSYPEIVYKTGDLVMLNDKGEYLYMGRADFQIKHKGYRIELGEIERVLGAAEKIDLCAAVYDKAEDKIVFVYTGRKKEDEVLALARQRLTDYMVPEVIKKLAIMPINQNGKIDRKYLMNNYKNL